MSAVYQAAIRILMPSDVWVGHLFVKDCVWNLFSALDLWFDNQTLQDSQNQTTDCDSVIDSTSWVWTPIFIGSTHNHPEDCFTVRKGRKIYRNTCCAACHRGQWIDRQINTCIDCNAGHQCPSSLDVSKNGPCDAGTYQPEPRKTSCKGSGIPISSNA